MIRLGLPKGRMASDTARFCAALGVEMRDGVLSYRATVGDMPVCVYLMKAPDVARLLQKGLLDLGLAGDEWLLETGAALSRRCFETRSYTASICLLMASGDPRPSRHIRSVATPYPSLTRRLLASTAPGCDVLPVAGSTEALVPDIADACVDVVETGTSAVLNALAIRESFRDVTTHLVRSEHSDPAAIAPVISLLAATMETAR